MQSRTSRSNPKNLKNPKKGAAIVKAAEHIFARKGFQAATVADIAKKAKVSEATIYEYFSSKEELLFAIPAETIREYQEKNREILPYIPGAANKLRFLIHRHLVLYENNPDYATVVMLILKGNPNFLKTESYRIVQLSARNYIEVIEEGMKNNEFSSDIDPYLIRAMIWGTIEHEVTRKSLLGKPEGLTSLTDSICNTIFAGISAVQPAAPIHVNVRVTGGE
ncbi:MAG: TetR/AcrR family transcriptional regulator [Desulfobacteraceae bacterium]|nr:TetR/AcrR family transcriptional regulator [Desulfobacteraceae bacterium]